MLPKDNLTVPTGSPRTLISERVPQIDGCPNVPTPVEDSEASITSREFRTLAWEAANEKARDLGWVKSCEELHEAVKRAGGAP